MANENFVYEHTLEMEIADGNFQTLNQVINFGIKPDQSTEDQTFVGGGGWQSSLIVGKSLAISVQKNFLPNEDVDKFINTMLFSGARAHNHIKMKITFPLADEASTTPAIVELTGALKISDAFAGDAASVSKLEFELMVSGQPTYTPEV